VVVTSMHVQSTLGLALFIAYFAEKHLSRVFMDVSYVNIESVFPRVMPSTVGTREVFITYKKNIRCFESIFEHLEFVRSMIGAHMNFQSVEALSRFLAHIAMEGFPSVLMDVSDVCL